MSKTVNTLLDKAEALAVQAENVIKNKPESLTKLTIALNEFRMGQVQALQEINEIVKGMELAELEYQKLQEEKKQLDKALEADKLNTDNKKLH